jgi:hypothetical protein
MLKLLYESSVVSEKDRHEKEKLILNELKGFKISKIQRRLLDACIPDLKSKEKIWDLLVYKDEDLFLDEYEAMMIGFARKSQYLLLKKFFKHRFFEDFIYVKNNHSSEYALMFFKHLAPRFVVNDEIYEKFYRMQKAVNAKDYKLFSMITNSKII